MIYIVHYGLVPVIHSSPFLKVYTCHLDRAPGAILNVRIQTRGSLSGVLVYISYIAIYTTHIVCGSHILIRVFSVLVYFEKDILLLAKGEVSYSQDMAALCRMMGMGMGMKGKEQRGGGMRGDKRNGNVKKMIMKTKMRRVWKTYCNGEQQGKVHEVVIVGGGLSGLSTAVALLAPKEAGEKKLERDDLVVTEARERVGGNITTVRDERNLWEEGPNSFQPNDAVLRMAVDVGLKESLVLGDPTAPRFVLWDKQLRKVPSSPLDFLSFELISFLGSIRAGLGAIGLRPSPPLNADGTQQEETVKDFVTRNLGEEVFMKAVEPFCSGVYAGDPTKLSMRAAFGKIVNVEDKGGSLIGGALKLMQEKKMNPPPPRDSDLPTVKGQTVGSFKDGLVMLPEAMEKFIGENAVKKSWTLIGITKDSESGIFTLTYSTASKEEKILKSKVVVMTTPAYVTGDVLRSQAPEVFDLLSTFYYPPVCAVTLAYPMSAIKDDRLDDEGKLPGFGQLHPRTQGVTTLGTIYSSSLFPFRAPNGELLILNYIGGATNTKISAQDQDAVIKIIDTDLRTMLIKEDAPEVRCFNCF